MPENTQPEVMDKKATQIAEFSKTEAALASLREKFTTIPDCSSKEGYEECRVGIRELVSLRTSLDKARKELNADDQARIKFRNDEAKRITGELVKLEDPMKEAKAKVDDAIEREKEEKRQQEERRIEQHTKRMNAITVCGNVDPTMESMDIGKRLTDAHNINVDYDFEEFADAAKAERQRVVLHIEKVLSDRLDFEEQQKEQTRIAKEQAEESARLKAEQDRINEENAERQRKMDEQQAAIDRQKAEAEAEEKRKADEVKAEEERKAQEEENKRKAEEADRLAAEEAARQEANKEDKEKLLEWAKKLRFIDGPDITDQGLLAILSAAQISLDVVAKHVIKKVEDY